MTSTLMVKITEKFPRLLPLRPLTLAIDLNEQFEVRLESGYDAFVVIDGLPVVPGMLPKKNTICKYLLIAMDRG